MDRPDEIAVTMDVRLPLRVAGLGSRAVAQVIDWTLLQLVQLALGLFGGCFIGLFAASELRDGQAVGWMLAALVLLIALLTAGWFIGYEIAWNGQTPGKRWLGLRVVAEDGSAADSTAILVRNVVRLVDFLPVGYFAGLVSMLFTERARRLGDLAAGTIVVVDEPAPVRRRRLPDGIADADARLVEAFFARAPTLEPARAEDLASRLLRRLGREQGDHPSAVQALAAAFPEEA